MNNDSYIHTDNVYTYVYNVRVNIHIIT